jgi:hypothetical protein
MALALKVGQRTRLHVAFLRVNGSPRIIAGPPTWVVISMLCCGGGKQKAT